MEQERGVESGKESGECHFQLTLLDELTKHLCGEMKKLVWNQTANKLVEEAYVWHANPNKISSLSILL